MNDSVLRVAEGFPRQRIDVLPPAVVGHYLHQPIVRDLMPIWIGHFPSARNHFIAREDGIDHSLLMWCVAGEGWITSDSGQTSVRVGDFAVLPAGQPHGYGTGSENPWTIYWFHFVGERMRDYIDLLTLEHQAQVRHVGLDTTLVSLFEELIISATRTSFSKAIKVAI